MSHGIQQKAFKEFSAVQAEESDEWEVREGSSFFSDSGETSADESCGEQVLHECWGEPGSVP